MEKIILLLSIVLPSISLAQTNLECEQFKTGEFDTYINGKISTN